MGGIRSRKWEVSGTESGRYPEQKWEASGADNGGYPEQKMGGIRSRRWEVSGAENGRYPEQKMGGIRSRLRIDLARSKQTSNSTVMSPLFTLFLHILVVVSLILLFFRVSLPFFFLFRVALRRVGVYVVVSSSFSGLCFKFSWVALNHLQCLALFDLLRHRKLLMEWFL